MFENLHFPPIPSIFDSFNKSIDENYIREISFSSIKLMIRNGLYSLEKFDVLHLNQNFLILESQQTILTLEPEALPDKKDFSSNFFTNFQHIVADLKILNKRRALE